jgi:hypothetical protein
LIDDDELETVGGVRGMSIREGSSSGWSNPGASPKSSGCLPAFGDATECFENCRPGFRNFIDDECIWRPDALRRREAELIRLPREPEDPMDVWCRMDKGMGDDISGVWKSGNDTECICPDVFGLSLTDAV